MATLILSFPDNLDDDNKPADLDKIRSFAGDLEATHAILTTTVGQHDLAAAPVSVPGQDGVPAAGLDASSVDPRDREIADLRAQLANRGTPSANLPADTTASTPAGERAGEQRANADQKSDDTAGATSPTSPTPFGS